MSREHCAAFVPKVPVGLCMVALVNKLTCNLLEDRVRCYLPPTYLQTLGVLTPGVFESCGHPVTYVGEHLGSIRNTATAAIDSSLWLSPDCTDQGWGVTTLCVSWRWRPRPKALMWVTGDGNCAFWEAPFRIAYSNLMNLTWSLKTNNKSEACILCVCLPLFHFSDHSFLWYFSEALVRDRLEIKPKSCSTKSENSDTAGSVAWELS